MNDKIGRKKTKKTELTRQMIKLKKKPTKKRTKKARVIPQNCDPSKKTRTNTFNIK